MPNVKQLKDVESGSLVWLRQEATPQLAIRSNTTDGSQVMLALLAGGEGPVRTAARLSELVIDLGKEYIIDVDLRSAVVSVHSHDASPTVLVIEPDGSYAARLTQQGIDQPVFNLKTGATRISQGHECGFAHWRIGMRAAHEIQWLYSVGS